MQDKLSAPKPKTICRVYTTGHSLEVQVDTDDEAVVINATTDLTLYSARYDIAELLDWFMYCALHTQDYVDYSPESSLLFGNCGGYRIVAVAQEDNIAYQLLSPIGSLIIGVRVPVNTFNDALESIEDSREDVTAGIP